MAATRVAAVFTRDLGEAPHLGRVRTLAMIKGALAQNFEILPYQIRPRTHSKAALLAQVAHLLNALIRGQPLPLQIALFGTDLQNRDLAHEILRDKPSAIYLDSIRCAGLLFALRRIAPDVRIVMDMDDLMSLRMSELLRRRLPISLGYIADSLPKPLRRTLESGIGRQIQKYERWSLAHVERRACAAADAVTLVSPTEVRMLQAALPASTRAAVKALPPPVPRIGPVQPVVPPISFCFVGSDSLVQNRQTIDFLLDLWRRTRPEAPLHIAGLQKRTPQIVANVIWRGLVPDLGDIYVPGSVLICPSFVEGGIKTKILEAFSYGIPVVGNATSFSGMALGDYPLCLPQEKLDDIVMRPSSWLKEFEQAARIGHDMLVAHHDIHSYAHQWRSILLPAPERP